VLWISNIDLRGGDDVYGRATIRRWLAVTVRISRAGPRPAIRVHYPSAYVIALALILGLIGFGSASAGIPAERQMTIARIVDANGRQAEKTADFRHGLQTSTFGAGTMSTVAQPSDDGLP
jgi:hypothetical protein